MCESSSRNRQDNRHRYEHLRCQAKPCLANSRKQIMTKVRV
jgi:hypothetical protein